MQHRTVIVGETTVTVRLEAKPHNVYHCRAMVDGEAHLYKIEKCPKSNQARWQWFERGMAAVHYDAATRGEYVRFEPVDYKRRSERKISRKQLSLWD